MNSTVRKLQAEAAARAERERIADFVEALIPLVVVSEMASGYAAIAQMIRDDSPAIDALTGRGDVR